MAQEIIPPDFNYCIEKVRHLQSLSKCKRLKVGAICLDSYYGEYNRGLSDCRGRKGRCGCFHAETRLLNNCPTDVKRILITHSPCQECARELIYFDVLEVLFIEEYRDPSGISILINGGVKCLKI